MQQYVVEDQPLRAIIAIDTDTTFYNHFKDATNPATAAAECEPPPSVSRRRPGCTSLGLPYARGGRPSPLVLPLLQTSTC